MMLYHLSFDTEEPNIKTFFPRIPKTKLNKEDQEIPRICFSHSVLGCINAMPDSHFLKESETDTLYRTKGVLYSLNTDDFPSLKLIDSYALYETGLLPDALINQECWCLEPVTLTGKAIELRPLSEYKNDSLHCVKEKNREFVYSIIDQIYDNYASKYKNDLDKYSLLYILNGYFYKFDEPYLLNREVFNLSQSPGTSDLIDTYDVYSHFMVDNELHVFEVEKFKYKNNLVPNMDKKRTLDILFQEAEKKVEEQICPKSMQHEVLKMERLERE